MDIARIFSIIILFSWVAVCFSADKLAESEDHSLQFIVIGDWGMQGSKAQHDVAAQMDRIAASNDINYIISTGDNFYPRGVKSKNDPLWEKNFEEVYFLPHLKDIPWYVSLGNHDYMGNIYAQIEYSREHDNWNIFNTYYTAEIQLGKKDTVQLMFIDTSAFLRGYHLRPDLYRHIAFQDPEQQINWIKETLDKTGPSWRIVFGHHPVYTSGPHGDTEELKRVLPELFEKYNVIAYFSGHDHHLEHIKKTSATHYFISGAGATFRRVGRGEYTRFSLSSLGFAHVILDNECMQVRFIQVTGKELYRTVIPARQGIACRSN